MALQEVLEKADIESVGGECARNEESARAEERRAGMRVVEAACTARGCCGTPISRRSRYGRCGRCGGGGRRW